jgi:cAMP-dependent protein kinase regulator
MFQVDKQEGDIIINQGDDGDNFYIIDNGSVDVLIKTIGSDEDAKLVKTCVAGDSFGELAIMYNAPRAVSDA